MKHKDHILHVVKVFIPATLTGDRLQGCFIFRRNQVRFAGLGASFIGLVEKVHPVLTSLP